MTLSLMTQWLMTHDSWRSKLSQDTFDRCLSWKPSSHAYHESHHPMPVCQHFACQSPITTPSHHSNHQTGYNIKVKVLQPSQSSWQQLCWSGLPALGLRWFSASMSEKISLHEQRPSKPQRTDCFGTMVQRYVAWGWDVCLNQSSQSHPCSTNGKVMKSARLVVELKQK